MTELEKLQQEIDRLKETVNELKSGTVKVETNDAKLRRLKTEILNEVFRNEYDSFVLSDIKQYCSMIATRIFPTVIGIQTGFQRMSQIIFAEDDENRLQIYLSIYKNCCEFIKSEFTRLGYLHTWEESVSQKGKVMSNGK